MRPVSEITDNPRFLSTDFRLLGLPTLHNFSPRGSATRTSPYRKALNPDWINWLQQPKPGYFKPSLPHLFYSRALIQTICKMADSSNGSTLFVKLSSHRNAHGNPLSVTSLTRFPSLLSLWKLSASCSLVVNNT